MSLLLAISCVVMFFLIYITVLTVMCTTWNVLIYSSDSFCPKWSSLICSTGKSWFIVVNRVVLNGPLSLSYITLQSPASEIWRAEGAEIWLPGCPSTCMFYANVSSGNPMLTQLWVKLLPFSRYRNVPGQELDHRGNSQTCSSVS